ncbi:DUF1244 domain-containing protein [Sandaracinobacteroides saxicola]|uniref:DUF1244 domain-containing protein n=1 Tax=Sandaracinobacteroides saxicola TaxID=2759707 RepID=A0A7G5IGS8_9SPHN|nr:DUF1244 domain-containing protein [Sandaracinobacteroides saxicola]QMW22570.1 DUF1244 domain-containing protein [Sandaracinobacteroides saxicola]
MTDSQREALEAAAFRRLLIHLRQRQDATNIDLMGLAGFCRNCLSEWLEDAAHDAGIPLSRDDARTHVYGEPYAAYKARQPQATPEQLARMDASLKLNERARMEWAAQETQA